MDHSGISESTQPLSTAAAASPYPLSKAHDFVLIRLFDRIGTLSGLLAAFCLLAMASIMSYEIGSRYFFNQPTASPGGSTWPTGSAPRTPPSSPECTTPRP